MIEQFESALREAFAERASGMPADAFARLRHTDYRPRSPIQSKVVALGGTAAAAGVAGIAVSLIGFGAGTPRAFAGWTPSPTAPASGQTTTAEATCKAHMATPAELERARQQASGRPSTPGEWPTSSGEWRTVLTDTRGPYTIVLLANTGGSARCLTGPGFPGPSVGVGEQSATSPLPTIPTGQLGAPSYGFSRATDEQPYMEISGRVGSGVSAVTFLLSDDSHVAASVENGWFLAWWPGSQTTVAAEVSTSAGTHTQQLDDPVGHTLLQLAH
jgi:hypothetical protein